jgi:Prokaryotic membrane lipoprotein lipid attachment site
MRRTMLLAVIAVVLSGCSLLTGLEGCTAVAIPSFSVTVRDSATRTPIAIGAQLSWTGPVSGANEFPWLGSTPPDPSVDSIPIQGPFEKAGTFSLTVRKTGYRDWNGSVTVKQDGCHVRSVSLTAFLQRIVA